jgi:hypothetical protein
MDKNSEIAAIGFASVGHTLCHLLPLLFPTVLLVLEVEMNLSFKEMAAQAVPAAFLFDAGALPAGWLGDRWSKTRLLEIFFYGTGAFTIINWICRDVYEVGLWTGRDQIIRFNLPSCRNVMIGFYNIQNSDYPWF